MRQRPPVHLRTAQELHVRADTLPHPALALRQAVHEAEAEILLSEAESESGINGPAASDSEWDAQQQPKGVTQVLCTQQLRFFPPGAHVIPE